MATSIEVNKKSVKELLESGKKNKFIIPEYQRPYAWTDEQIQTLFDDLVEYTNDQTESSYFLGSIVSFDNNNGEQEIIDGQQRISTLFLLLRAIYTKLSNSTIQSAEVKNFMSQIEPAIWEKERLSGEVNFSNILITSKVISSEDNEVFAEILEAGETKENSDDRYSKNYRQIQKLIDDYAKNEPLQFYYFIDNILNQSILLPIKADSQDTALTIFSTLNDRGLPLSDSDIFKAKIYNQLNDKDKKGFIKKWQELDEQASDSNESIQRLFYYYMFYLRAIENDKKSTTPGLRKYYSQNNFKRLHNPNLLSNLSVLLNLWTVINKKEAIDEEKWSENVEIRKILDVLSSYPNEFWKYPVSIFYLTYKDNPDFESLFLNFNKKLFAHLAARYVVTPTINAVKTSILNLNTKIIQSPNPKFEFNPVDWYELKERIKNPHKNTVRMILKLLAYQEQQELLPHKWEIEHIFPRKWQNNYFINEDTNTVKKLIEHIGNKIPFEKKLNIVAGNGYFEKKKQQYKNSKINITRELANSVKGEWGLEHIRERSIRISDSLMDLFYKWGLDASTE